jgi:hypothetical protein
VVILLSQSKYWVKRGLFRPYSFVSISLEDSDTLGFKPNCSVKGFPGARCMTKKDINVMPIKIGIINKILLVMYIPITAYVLSGF